jgi:tetratricopeptide (TPR) repeat protein
MGEAFAVAKGTEGWERILRDYGVEWIIIRYRSRDSSHFFRSGQWRCVYWDNTALVAVSDSVRGMGHPGLRYFPLSNPVVFEATIKDSPPDAILRELEQIIALNPDCATAWAERSRCLLRKAEQDGARKLVLRSEAPLRRVASELTREALAAAQRAVSMNDRLPAPWQALGQCYHALGLEKEARTALRKADSLKTSHP